MTGQQKTETKIVISRFPADSGILAEEHAKGLSVEFLERIFMKSATSYKAAVYSGRSLDKDFWKGKAVDKQINSADSIISDYWIRDFLRSDFLTPGEAVKEDIAALQHLVAGMPRRVLSANQGGTADIAFNPRLVWACRRLWRLWTRLIPGAGL